jgi:hypothetical protein
MLLTDRQIRDAADRQIRDACKKGAIKMEGDGMALSDVLTTLRSLSANVGTLTSDLTALTNEMKHYKWVVPVLLVIGMAIIGAIVAIK